MQWCEMSQELKEISLVWLNALDYFSTPSYSMWEILNQAISVAGKNDSDWLRWRLGDEQAFLAQAA
jgi:hypothetical protein